MAILARLRCLFRVIYGKLGAKPLPMTCGIIRYPNGSLIRGIWSILVPQKIYVFEILLFLVLKTGYWRNY